MTSGGGGKGAFSQTVPRSLSRFDTHPGRPPVTQNARSRRSYGKIAECEQCNRVRTNQIKIFLEFHCKEPIRFEKRADMVVCLCDLMISVI